MIYHDAKTCLTSGLHKLSPLNKKAYYFKLSGDNLWVVKGPHSITLKTIIWSPCSLQGAYCNKLCFPPVIFLATHRNQVFDGFLPQVLPALSQPCWGRLSTNWVFRPAVKGAFTVAGQTLLSAFSSIEGQTIREAELGALWENAAPEKAGLGLLEAHELMRRRHLCCYFRGPSNSS